MRSSSLVSSLVLPALILFGGCAADYKVAPSGFLAEETYASLDDGEFQDHLVTWSNEAVDVEDYRAFLVDPIELRIDDDADARDMTVQKKTELAEYFHGQVVDFLGADHAIVEAAGPDVLRVRIAVTDVRKAVVALNIHPATSIAGFGLGAAAMEAEVTDSMTGDIVFAMMGGRRGSPFGLEKLDPWGHAKEAMDLWAEHLAENIAERPVEMKPPTVPG